MSDSKKKRQKRNHVLILTSDAVDAQVTQLHIRTWIFHLFLVIVSVGMGFVIGYIIYQEEHKNDVWGVANDSVIAIQAVNQELAERNRELENQVAELQGQVEILSNTVNQKIKNEEELTQRLDEERLPTTLPLTGSASVESVTEGDPMSIFKVAKDTLIVASGEGTVLDVAEDEVYGHCVIIDHENGYVSYYKNANDCLVKPGEMVHKGTTLFIIEQKENILGYQITKDGAYIDPLTMFTISG